VFLVILLHQSWSRPLSSFLVANSVDSEVCLGGEGCYCKVDCPLHSRSPPLSTRGIIRESDILVRLAASVLVSISESLPYGRTRQRSAALPFNGNRQGMALARGQRCSHSLPFFTQFAWQLTSTCNERISFSPARRLLTCREQAGVSESLTSARPLCAGLPVAEVAALSFVTRLSIAFMWWPGVAWMKSTLHTGRSLAIYDYINSDVFLNITVSIREKQRSPDRTSFYLTNLAS
jgi:hypothetical protein